MKKFYPYLCVGAFVVLVKIFRSIWRRNINLDFSNKTIWLTGASSGIGEELAYQLSKLGATLIISARRENELERVKKGCANPEKVIILPLDLSDPEKVMEQAQQYLTQSKQKIDILINNGGISMRSAFIENSFENDITMLNVNYLSQVALTKAVLPGMLERKSGHIVYMNSLQGKVGVAFRTGYAATKHALTGFADSLRAEVEDNGVYVTSLYPGYVSTNLSLNALSSDAGTKHGKMDANTKKGINPGVFADKAIRSIFLKEREVIIADSVANGLAVPLRNLIPNLIFWLVEKKKKKELKQQQQQQLLTKQKAE